MALGSIARHGMLDARHILQIDFRTAERHHRHPASDRPFLQGSAPIARVLPATRIGFFAIGVMSAAALHEPEPLARCRRSGRNGSHQVRFSRYQRTVCSSPLSKVSRGRQSQLATSLGWHRWHNANRGRADRRRR